MPHAHFISDLHLCPSRPDIHALFFDFLKNKAAKAESLFVLGDLFEYWIGDDDIDAGLNGQVVAALAAVADGGARVYFMHGNRDFLIGDDFARQAKLTLLPDPSLIDLFGTRTLLMHGDTLCSDDTEYQRFRTQVRSLEWQRRFFAKSLSERRSEVELLRRRSEEAKRAKPLDIMDVTAAAVDDVFRTHGCQRLIHGHTHRPAHHIHVVDGKPCERWVLPDWPKHGGGLVCSTADWQFFTLG